MNAIEFFFPDQILMQTTLGLKMKEKNPPFKPKMQPLQLKRWIHTQ